MFINCLIFLTPSSLEGLPPFINSIPDLFFFILKAPAPLVAAAVITNSPSLNIAGISSEVPVPGPIDSPPSRKSNSATPPTANLFLPTFKGAPGAYSD